MISQFAFDDGPSGEPVGPFFECIAVSTTNDPLQSYYRYSFPLGDIDFPDYPHFGVWPDGYYMTVHIFGEGEIGFKNLGVFVFDREAMLRGPKATRQFVFSDPGTFKGMLPADIDGPSHLPWGPRTSLWHSTMRTIKYFFISTSSTG